MILEEIGVVFVVDTSKLEYVVGLELWLLVGQELKSLSFFVERLCIFGECWWKYLLEDILKEA